MCDFVTVICFTTPPRPVGKGKFWWIDLLI